MIDALTVNDLDPNDTVFRVVRQSGDRRVHTSECPSVEHATSKIERYSAAEYAERFSGDTLVCKNCAGRDYDRGAPRWDHYRLARSIGRGEDVPDDVTLHPNDTQT